MFFDAFKFLKLEKQVLFAKKILDFFIRKLEIPNSLN